MDYGQLQSCLAQKKENPVITVRPQNNGNELFTN